MSKYQRLIEKVELFHKLAVYGDRNSFLQAISQMTPSDYDIPLPDPNLASPPSVPVASLPNVPVPAKSKAPGDQRIINLQTMINVLLKGTGTAPLDTDGRIGDLTKAALKAVADKYHVPPTADGVRQAYESHRVSNIPAPLASAIPQGPAKIY